VNRARPAAVTDCLAALSGIGAPETALPEIWWPLSRAARDKLVGLLPGLIEDRNRVRAESFPAMTRWAAMCGTALPAICDDAPWTRSALAEGLVEVERILLPGVLLIELVYRTGPLSDSFPVAHAAADSHNYFRWARRFGSRSLDQRKRLAQMEPWSFGGGRMLACLAPQVRDQIIWAERRWREVKSRTMALSALRWWLADAWCHGGGFVTARELLERAPKIRGLQLTPKLIRNQADRAGLGCHKQHGRRPRT
jgi:hypothetical protein